MKQQEFKMPTKKLLQPKEWKKITARYPKEFSFKSVLGQPVDGKWLWQAGPDAQVDITNWKLYWKVPHSVLFTLDEFNAFYEVEQLISSKIASEKEAGYGGIDIALDSDEFCSVANHSHFWNNKDIVKALTTKFNGKYSYDNSVQGDHCKHHLSISW